MWIPLLTLIDSLEWDRFCSVKCNAELPATMTAFLGQQHRWTKGLIQTAKKLLPRILFSRASLKVKLEAWFHLTSPLMYLVIFLVTAVALPALFLATHGKTYKERRDMLGPNVRANVEEGLGYNLEDYARAAAAQIVRNEHVGAREAVREHPEIAGTYLNLRAAELASRALRGPQDRQRFVAHVRSALPDDIERGEPLQPVRLRERAAARAAKHRVSLARE